MPEEVQVPSSPTQEITQPQIPVELAKQMQTSLAGFVPGMQSNQPQEAAVDNGAQAPTENAPLVTPTEVPIVNEWYKDLGYDSGELAKSEIQKLKEQKPPDIKFDNDISEKLYKAIQGGKMKEISELLSEQQNLDSLTTVEVNDNTAEQIIKTGMRLKFKDLTTQEIDYKFKKQYAFPKEPIQSVDELEDEFAARKSAWQEQMEDIRMNRNIDAKQFRPDLEAAKAKIVFPEIQNQVDQDYVQWKQLMDKQSKLDTEIQEAYKTVTPKSVETKIPFIDETNKIKFEFQYEPDSDSFKKTVESATDVNKFLESFVKSDGTFDKQEYLAAIHFARNRTAIITEAMKQSKNATIKSFLPDNGASGTQRQFPQTQELSELDKQMKMSLNGHLS